jgi:hypothetical protein
MDYIYFFARLLQALCTVLLGALPVTADGVDDLHRLIGKVLSADHSACGGRYVGGNVYVTLTNHYHFRLVLLQRQALEIESARRCVESQFVTVCIDHQCMNDCIYHDIPNCVHISTYKDVAPSDFAQKEYWYTSLEHHLLIRDTLALAEVRSMCLIDADIVLFDSPTNYYDTREYGFRHQVEGGEGCSAAVNGGFLCFRNEPAALAFANELIRRNATWLAGGMDQGEMPKIAAETNLTRCALPKNEFIGHCGGSHSGGDLYRNLIAYHTNCATGNDKYELLSHVVQEMKVARSKEGENLSFEQGGL